MSGRRDRETDLLAIRAKPPYTHPMCSLCDFTFVGLAMPQLPMLASYADALRQGWSPQTDRDVSGEQLAQIAVDPQAFLASLADDQPPGRTRKLPDGRVVEILPQRVRWIWDGAFCGAINLRWAAGTSALPDYVLGHIGYAVVPWKRGHGLAKRALRHILEEAREVGLTQVDISTATDNVASQRVILASGGRQIDTFVNPLFGDTRRHLYRIAL
jgi:predicted acetyltransferase